MDIDKILEFVKCPYCVDVQLAIVDNKLRCKACGYFYDVVDGVPVLVKKDKLDLQELKQLEWFDKHYSDFSKDEYNLENWRLSMVNRIFDPVVNKKINTYLDIGCGATGYTVIEAAKRNKWLSFGADISLEAMLRANNLAKKQGLRDTTAFIVCSAQKLPFRQSTFDYVSAVSLLEHLQDDHELIREFYSILREQGNLFICVPNTYKRMWPFLWPVYFYFDRKIGHIRHYSIEALSDKMAKENRFELEDFFYNGHLIKFYQILLDKIGFINEKNWWSIEKKDINKVSSGVQLNAIFRKNR